MGNTPSNSSSKHTLDSLIFSKADKRKEGSSAATHITTTGGSPHSIPSGLSLFHSGWHHKSHSNPSTEQTTSTPPPPYSASGSDDNAAEDVLDLLRKYNIVFVVDDSTSMSVRTVRGTRWDEAGDALASIAEVAAKYDMDGIDVHFLNNKVANGHKGLKSAASVRSLFSTLKLRPSTPIGEKLEELLLSYMHDLEAAKASGDKDALKAVKPVNFITITDGEPTDDPESVIIAAAKRLDDGKFPLSQVGIQFVQVGNSAGASRYLQDLDSQLHTRQGMRDIVDTTPYTGKELDAESLVKILLGGINRRIDRNTEPANK